MYKKRTDLALEAHEMWKESAEETANLPGVKAEEYEKEGFKVTKIEILDEQGEKELDKPRGKYITIDLGPINSRAADALQKASSVIAQELKALPLELKPDAPVLVAGLGNRNITPDAVGPKAAEYVIATRHLVTQMPNEFKGFRQVCALTPGVLGLTGVETGEIIKGVCEHINPSLVIAIDALASRRLNRLCTTVQISNTGIEPGSGVGNTRFSLTKDSLGVPVVAIGVPTVVDAVTLALDVAETAGVKDLNPDDLLKSTENPIVTPKDIDRHLCDAAKMIGYGIDFALQDNLTVSDIELFLS
ncbi:MAG: GPR endopeptidase [Bacillota bacterium]|nr:GPR endopeptidase [Bacillota bacterium]